MSLLSGYRSNLLAITGKRFRRSDRVPVDGDDNKTTYGRTNDRSRNELTDREKTTSLLKEMCHRQPHGVLYDRENESRRRSGICDRGGAL